jgi:hypothetical protein
MTQSGMKALRRYARRHRLPHAWVCAQAESIDRAIDACLADDPHADESDRGWLEAAVRVPSAMPILFAFHYRGVRPGEGIH